MQSLLRNKVQWISLGLLFSSCTSPSYKVLNQVGSITEILVAPSRVLLHCEDVQDPTEKPTDSLGRFGFNMDVLDEQNTVLSVSQGSVIGKKDCNERLEKIGKILRNGKQIYIGAIGNIDAPRVREKEWPSIFPGIGTFYSNSRALQFIVISNEKGECYSAYFGSEKPCPRDEFPIKGK
jgi:hypothetical protein